MRLLLNKNTYETFFKKHYAPLVAYACKITGNIETSKEIVQDFFVHLYENIDNIKIGSSVQGYLYTSIRNRCISHFKHLEVIRAHEKSVVSKPIENEDLNEVIETNELQYQLYKLIENLPSRQREVFELSRFQGISNPDIAKQLDISLRTVETQISNALKYLRKNIQYIINFFLWWAYVNF